MAPTDAALVERWRSARDADAFAEVVARYSGMVYGTCRRILRNASDAEEVAQECFLALAQAQSPVPRSLGAWLHTVATRRSLDRIKSERRRLRRESEVAAGRAEVGSDWDDIKAHVDEAIAALPEEWRGPVVQRFLEGRTHEDIAEALDIPRTTVQYRIGKGLDAVADTLRRRGVTVGAAALASSLASASAEATPASFTASLGKLVIAAGSLPPSAAGASIASWLTTGGLLIMLKKGVLALLVVGMLAGLSYGALRYAAPEAAPVKSTAVVAQSSPAPTAPPQDEAPGAAPPVQPAEAAAPKEAEPRREVAPLRGRVVDAQGAGVADATVAFSGFGTEFGQKKTDNDGRFGLELLAGKPYGVGASKLGVGIGYIEGVVPGSDEITITLRAGGILSGRVTDKATGKGISDVRVAAEVADPRAALAAGVKPVRIPTQKTDADGSYTIVVPAPGRFRAVVLEAGAYMSPGEDGPEVDVAKDGAVDGVDFALARGGVVFGTVATPDGKPCAKAVVTTEVKDLGAMRGRGVQTQADGQYRLEGLLPGQDYRVTAMLEPYAAFVSPVVHVPAAEEVGPVHLRLTSGHAARGRAVDADGRPVPGIEVLAFAIEPGDRGHNHFNVGVDKVATDARGAFTLAPLGPGTYRINAHAPGGEFSTTDFIMPADADLTDLEVKVSGAGKGVISGRVVFPDRSPIANVTIQSMGEGSSDFAYTGPDGAFTLKGLPDGLTHRLVVSHRTGYTGASVIQTGLEDVPTGQTGLTIFLGDVFEACGTVVDAATGKPITKFEALVAATSVPGGGMISTHPNPWRTFESSTGEFRLPLPSPVKAGTVVLAVRADGYAEAKTEELPLEDGRTTEAAEIRLEPAAGLSGLVTDSAGKPLEGARVITYEMIVFSFLFEHAKEGGYATTGPDGRFNLAGVKTGVPVKVAASLEGYALGAVAGVMVDPKRPAEVTIVLPEEARLKASVTLDGQPVPKAMVQITLLDDGLYFGESAMADSEGVASIRSLRAGQCNVGILAEAPSPAEWIGQTDLVAGDNTVEFPLRPAGLIKGKLTAPASAGRLNIVGQPLDDPSRGMCTNTLPDGSFHFVATPGRWRVFASPDGLKQMSNVEEFEIKAGEETALELVVP